MTASKVRQIKIGKNLTGFVGLDRVLEEMIEPYAQASYEVVATEMIKRLSKKNYIPDNAHAQYGRAFVREFRKFTGQPYVDDSPISELDIKVHGGGCNICDSLENDLMEILTEMGLAANLEHIRDADQIAQYKVKGLPALIINGQVKSVGVSPPKPELKRWIEDTGYKITSGGSMEKPVFIKNIQFSENQKLTDLVDYEHGRVVSRTFAQKPNLSVTLFAFDAGEGISTHTAPGDAMVQVIDGEAVVNIDGNEMTVQTGEVVVMPANVPHSVSAVQQFKMLLTVVK
jgi:quercetin dioxygenase-like cupin family protein